MKSCKAVVLALIVSSGIVACGGGSSGGGAAMAPDANPTPPAPPPPQTPAAVGFTSYSKEMQAASEDSVPWDVEGVTFTFDADDNPAAYDDVLPPPT